MVSQFNVTDVRSHFTDTKSKILQLNSHSLMLPLVFKSDVLQINLKWGFPCIAHFISLHKSRNPCFLTNSVRPYIYTL